MIRPAAPGDLPRIREIVAAAFDGYTAEIGQPAGPILTDYEAELRQLYLLEQDGRVAGLIGLYPLGDALQIEPLAVDPGIQGTGAGRALMGFAEEQARALALPRLWLYSNAVMRGAIAFYARLGFVEIARRVEHGYSRVYMEKRLG